ncbi:MAG: hypothetical protein HYS53_00805 [Candidatus Aenigmarchaeota archaeon]|nr:hypothetical protein [Candidatus Aenigmarchaeota archaeon]
MKQTLTDLGLPNVWGVLFTQSLDIVEVFPRNFDAVDIRALAEINEVLNEWITARGVSEIVDAENNLYVGKIGENVLYVSGDAGADFSQLWEIVSNVKMAKCQQTGNKNKGAF